MFAGNAGIVNPSGGRNYELDVDTGRVTIHNATRQEIIYVGTLSKPFIEKILASSKYHGRIDRAYRAELEVAHPKPIMREVFYERGAIATQKFHDDIWVL